MNKSDTHLVVSVTGIALDSAEKRVEHQSMRLASHVSVALLLAIGLHFLPGPADAQSLWLDRDHPTTILLEADHVDMDSTHEKILTGVVFLDVRHEIAPGKALVVEVPYTRMETPFEPFNDVDFTQASIGNPYFGVEIGGDSPLFGEIGVRALLMSNSNRDTGARFVGLFSDLPRSFAFFEDAVPIQAALNLRTPITSDIRARLRFGATAAVPTKSVHNTDLYGVYAWEIGYEGRHARIGSALSGWVLLKPAFGNLGSRTATQFEFHADFGGGRIRPGVEVRVPFGFIAEDFNSSVWGFSLAFVP